MKNIEEKLFSNANEVEKMLGLQKFPAEAEKYLGEITANSREYGWPLTVIKAFCLGVIYGKREDRRRKVFRQKN